ncbi:MAG TPA: DUF4214 domain-containing protein [Pirellulales bacterium]
MMFPWPISARSAKKKPQQKQAARRFSANRPWCESLEPRLLLAADLSITKSQASPVSGGVPAAVVAGEMISYEITVANSGNAAAANTTITDPLPLGETLIHASLDNNGGVSLNNNTLTANVGTLAAGAGATLTIDALINGQVSGTLTNAASVSSSDVDNGLPILSSPVSTSVNALDNTAANLSITKTAANNNAAVSIGDTESYTITVSNNGTNAANNVAVFDTLPAGATFVTGTVLDASGQSNLPIPSGGLETINLGTLSAGTSAIINMTITAPHTVGLMANSATVTTDSGNVNAANAVAGVNTSVQGVTQPGSGNVDLSIVKTAPANGSVGASETSTIVVTNNGTAVATGVVISDALPSGMQFLGGSILGNSGINVTDVNGLVSAMLPSLAVGASATLNINTTPTITGALTDNAFVEANQPDSNQANNQASATVLVNGVLTPAVDLSVAKTASTPTGTVGSELTYTITVTNNSANAATGVIVSDLLPSGATFVSATDSTGATLTPNGNTLVDRLGGLAANGTATVTVTVTPDAVGVLTDTASVAGDQVDTNLANNTATLSTPVHGAAVANVDLDITKAAANNNADIGIGANETYTITVTNNGTDTASGVVVTDILPPSVNFVSGTTSVAGVNVSSANGTVTANLGSLGAGDSATVTLTVTPTAAGAMTDTAYVEGDQTDTNQSNNTASVTTNVVSAAQQANLSIYKVATPNPATADQPLTYSLIVTNTGAAPANNVTVSDALPSGLTFVSGDTSVNGVAVTNNNGQVTANLGTVVPGAIDTITIVVTPNQAESVNNTATVSTSTVNASLQTSATVHTTIGPAVIPTANLSIYKVAAPNPGTVGENETYTLVVTNTGAGAAANVNVTDTLPAGVTYVSGSTSVAGVTVANNNGSVTADLGNVAAGAVDTLTIIVTPTQSGTLTNTASVTTDTTNTSTQTSATVNTVINPAVTATADLSIYKSGAPNPGTVGENETYTLVVVNTGAADAQNVNVTDTLPAGVTYVSGSASVAGVTVTNNNGSVTADLGNVAAGAVDTLTIIVTPTQSGTLTNTASVTTDTTNSSTHTSSTVNTVINPAVNATVDLSIYKSGAPNPGAVGENETYTLVVVNTGAADAQNVNVTDTLPAGVTYVSGSASVNGVSVTNNNGSVTANLGNVAAGAVDTLTIIVTPTQSGTLTNTASVSTDTTNTSTHTSSTVNTIINPAVNATVNLSIYKIAVPDPGTVGQNETYTLVVTNTGTQAAANVNVTDTLPSTVTYVSGSASVNGVSVTNNNGSVTANLGSVAAGAVDTLTIIVTPTQTGPLENTASVTTDSTNSSTHTTATTDTLILPAATNAADLSITKKASPDPVAVGQSLTYTIVVTDAAGAADANGVVVTDTLPTTGIGANVTAVDTTLNSNLTVINGVITDNIGTLAAGSSDTITVTVTPTQAGTLTNTANVTTTTSNSSDQTSATVQTTVQAATNSQYWYLNGQAGDGTDRTFVTNLYRELLGREPDPQGLQSWLNVLQQTPGSSVVVRQEVIEGFLHSEEYKAHWINGVFEEFLGRAADPVAQGYLVKALDLGVPMQLLVTAVLSSPEFFARSGGTDADFVQAVYNDLLGHGVSPAEQQTLASELDDNILARAALIERVLYSSEEAGDLLRAPGSTPGAPGTPATGDYPLAVLTGGGWDNLYFQGHLGDLNSTAVNEVMAELEAGYSWQFVEQSLLALPQYYDAG